MQISPFDSRDELFRIGRYRLDGFEGGVWLNKKWLRRGSQEPNPETKEEEVCNLGTRDPQHNLEWGTCGP